MSTPIALPSDLETFLGMEAGTINTTRATQIISFAQALCESIVFPLPANAMGTVLQVAARSFSNPEGVTSESVGPYHVTRGAAALYLTRGDKATLRRLSGKIGAFSIDTMPLGTNAVQIVTITATGGTFRLALSGQYTSQLAYNATPGDVAAAIAAIPLIGLGNVTVTGTGPYTVTFVNKLATTPVPTMIGDPSALTGTSPSVNVITSIIGVFAPGQNLAPWDKDYFFNDSSASGVEYSGGVY